MALRADSKFVRKVVSRLTFEETWKSMIEDINQDVVFAGKPIHTIRLLEQIRTAMIVSALVLLPLSVALMILISPIAIILNLFWIILLLLPKIQQTQLAQERKKQVEEELPAFGLFASVMQSVGINLYESFQLFRKTNLFKAMSHESQLLRRNVDFFGVSQMEALEELGRTHRSQSLTNLILGYTTIWRSGGDLANYLETRSEDLFVNLKERYQSYANNVGTVVELLVTLLIILPILIMVVSFIVPGASIEQVGLLAAIGLPFLAIVLGVIISSIQPASFNTVGLDQKILVVLFLIGFTISLGLIQSGQELWLSLAIGFIVPSAISAIIAGKQTNEIKNHEIATPQFLRDMTEYKKVGYDVRIAFSRLAKENYYNSKFASKLSEVAILMDRGITPINSVMGVSFRAWITKISFFILAYISEYGGGKPTVLETINRFVTNARQAVREGTQSISVLVLLIFASPVIMVFTAGILQNILGSIDLTAVELATQSGSSPLQGGYGLSENFINLVTITPEFLSMIKVMIVTSSILSAFVIGKAIDFTFYNTWRVVVVGLITIASILTMDYFAARDFNFENITGSFSLG